MQVWTLNELFRLTRAELTRLHQEIASALAEIPEGSPDREIALANLRNISSALGRPILAPS